MENYDPNNCFGMHTVELTFQSWDYKLVVSQKVGGNCKGFTILEAALQAYGDKLYEEQGENPTLILTDDEGNTLETEAFTTCDGDDDEPDIEEFLSEMLVKAEIIDFVDK